MRRTVTLLHTIAPIRCIHIQTQILIVHLSICVCAFVFELNAAKQLSLTGNNIKSDTF